MERVKYLTKQALLEANRAAVRERRRRVIPEEHLECLPDDFRVVARFYYHSASELRLLLSLDGNNYQLDISHTRYHSLPEVTRLTDGSIVYESPDSSLDRRPYPNKREWKEVIVTSPVRQQDRFRRDVLRAYDGQCAVCNVREPKLLRAAHIVAVSDGGPDETTNGICLCINHEVAFDRGLLLIRETFEVISTGNDDLQVTCSTLRLPRSPLDAPSQEYLRRKLQHATNSGAGAG
jgi:putative restriction endonuclease